MILDSGLLFWATMYNDNAKHWKLKSKLSHVTTLIRLLAIVVSKLSMLNSNKWVPIIHVIESKLAFYCHYTRENSGVLCVGSVGYTAPLAYPAGGSLQDNSPTNQLAVRQVADWTTRGLVNSLTTNLKKTWNYYTLFVH